MKPIISAFLCCLLFGCTSSQRALAPKEKIESPQAAQGNPVEDKEAQLEKLLEVLARLDPGPLSREEYSALTRYPYSREPFLNNELASQAYFNGFRSGFVITVRQPGQLVIRGKQSGSIIDAAKDAGFSAAMTGMMSQLTEAERIEVNEWKQKYEDVSMWPYFVNAEVELKIKSQLLLELDDADH